MRICLFTPSFLPKLGGMEIVIDRLARCFLDRGHEVTVLAKTPREMTDAPVLPYPAVYYPRTRSQVWFLGSTRRALLTEHERRRFDIVHVHQAYPTGYVAVKLRDDLGVPVVITSHRGDIGEASRYRRRRITRDRMVWAMRRADAVTGVSDKLQRIIDDLTGGQARSLVIPNGVDVEIEPPTQPPPEIASLPVFGRDGPAPFMLTLGRLHPYKGLDVLLEAMAILARRGTTAPHLVIAGDGKIRPDLEAQAERLGVSGSVSFTGAVLGEAKNWLLANCEFFVQPSREEGMPLTVLEAMATGKAIIGSDLHGIRQLITHDRSGLTVPVGSASQLAQAVADLAGDPSLRDRLSAVARETARRYDWPAVVDRYLELFQSLLSGTGEVADTAATREAAGPVRE